MTTQTLIICIALVLLSGVMFVFGGSLAGLAVVPILVLGTLATNESEEEEDEK